MVERIILSNFPRKKQLENIQQYMDHLDSFIETHPETGDDHIIDQHGDWGSIQTCTKSARWLAYHVNGHVMGYDITVSFPGRIGQNEGGHDIAICGSESQFIVDYWAARIKNQYDHPGILHRRDDSRRIQKWYGDSDDWFYVNHSGDPDRTLKHQVQSIPESTSDSKQTSNFSPQ